MKHSAGIIVVKSGKILLGHPGGPFYRGKHEGVWSMPKGCFEQDETPLDAALREFQEETGVLLVLPPEKVCALPIIPGKHKTLYPFVVNFYHLDKATQDRLEDVGSLKSNTCEIIFRDEIITIPELDCFKWFNLSVADYYISPRQVEPLDYIREVLSEDQKGSL